MKKILTIILIFSFTGCITIQPCTCPQQPITGSLQEVPMLPYYPPIYHPITIDTGFGIWRSLRLDTLQNNHGWLISSDTLRTLTGRLDTTNLIRFIR